MKPFILLFSLLINYAGYSQNTDNKNNISLSQKAKYKNVVKIKKNTIALVQSYNDKWGVIDQFGNNILPLIYDDISTHEDNYFVIKRDDLCGIADLTGRIVIPVTYELYGIHKHIMFASKKSKYYIVNILTRTSTPVPSISSFKYRYPGEVLRTGLQIVERAGKFGVMNTDMIFVVPIIYDSIEYIESYDEFVVGQKNKYGIVDRFNNIQAKIEYDEIMVIKEYARLIKAGQKTELYSMQIASDTGIRLKDLFE